MAVRFNNEVFQNLIESIAKSNPDINVNTMSIKDAGLIGCIDEHSTRFIDERIENLEKSLENMKLLRTLNEVCRNLGDSRVYEN